MSINVAPPAIHPFPPPPPIEFTARPQFQGQSADFRRIAIRGALLEFVTFGFYRFWLATRLRRHLWSNTLIAGEPFEYTGTGRELFVGFLFALAILVPIYFVYFLFGVEAERQKAFASTPLFIFLYAFGQFALYRARRYRLTRTVWRGIRFWMDGSGFGYAWRACLWGVLVYLTLGLALPWREAALERYKMRHTYYGDLQGEFVGTGWEFFKRGWWLWLLAWTPLVIIIGAAVVAAAIVASTGATSGQSEEEAVAAAVGGVVAVAMLLASPLIPFLYAAFKATEWRWWASGLRFGKLTVASNLGRDALFGNYWATIGWSILFFFGFFVALVAAVVWLELTLGKQAFEAMMASAGQGSPAGIAIIGVYFGSYFAMILAVGVVMRVYLMRGVWQKIIDSVKITGLEAADSVTARGEAANALGEGFADSLDIAGF
jgi:uncharacterized membrane protein YjgN (DUF898 family)